MALSNDPTRTRGIEKRWRREINRRFREFRRKVIPALRRLNESVIQVNQFDPDPEQLRIYMAFFQAQLDQIIVGSWQEKYQRQSYERAIQRALAELKRQGAATTISELERRIAQQVDFTVIPSLGLSADAMASLPLHQDALEFLFTRSFEALDGMSRDMARQVRGILFDSAREGLGVEQVARLINRRIEVGMSRSRLIAQTETIQAYQRGTINQARTTSDFIGEEVKLRWTTVRDSKVRDLHRQWHGEVFTEQEAQRNIGKSPYNCRCGLIPVIAESDTKAKREKFRREREQLTAGT